MVLKMPFYIAFQLKDCTMFSYFTIKYGFSDIHFDKKKKGHLRIKMLLSIQDLQLS